MSTHARLNSIKAGIGASALVAALALSTVVGVGAAHADGEPGDAEFLDTAEDFVIIAAAQVTETSGSEVFGNVGVHAGSAQELLVAQVDGSIHVGSDAVGQVAMADATAAYNTLALADVTPVVGDITANLAGSTYLAGVYNNETSLLLDGIMTLNGLTADDVWIFQAATEDLTVLAGSSVVLTGLAQACNVYWQVGSSATIGVGSNFVGTVIAYSNIWVETNAVIEGRVFALTGEVTLDDNTIRSQTNCVRTSTVGTVTTTTTRLDGDVDVVVVDSATPPTTTPGGSGGGSTTAGFTRPTGLQNTGSLARTGSETDFSAPMIAVGLMILLGLALVAVPRIVTARSKG